LPGGWNDCGAGGLRQTSGNTICMARVAEITCRMTCKY